MKIKTKINVNYNAGLVGTVSGIISGEICTISIFNNMNTVSVGYRYVDLDGNIITQSMFDINGVDIDTLSLSIFNQLPEDYNKLFERERMQIKYYSGFALQMAQTFGITTDDIEFID